MTLTESLIAELTQEAATTRRVLERVPEDSLSWTPHSRAMNLGTLALHVATIPGALAELLSETTRDLPEFERQQATSRAELLEALDESVTRATKQIAEWQDAGLMAEWRMVHGDQTLLQLPRVGMVRAIMLNHWYHHRGQLVVYLRLLDVAIPSVYGPSGDENPFAPAGAGAEVQASS